MLMVSYCDQSVRLACDHLFGKLLFTWLSLVMSIMVSFVLSFFPRDVLDEILNLIESVSEDFPSYFCPSSVVRALSTFCFKRLLLQNCWTDFEIISQEGSLGDPLPKLLKPFRSVEQDGRQS